MCEAIYIGNTHHIFKKRMDSNLSDILRLLENRKKLDSFDAHYEQNYNATASHTDIRKYITFKVVKQKKTISAMKTFTTNNCNLCMEEHLMIRK